ncbi:MAG: ankyrin repeat domain-containing protein [Planctomycetes bacterium]|nr:ankyrin repeat domain-containing protein [Planctomycetota bacterium]
MAKQTVSEILALARRQAATKTPERIAPPPEDLIPLPPFINAAHKGDINTVINELANGANINEAAYQGMTALGFALRQHHWEIAHYLVDAGADVNCVEAEIPPLHDAIAGNDITLVKKMLASGADICAHCRTGGLTALMRAESTAMIDVLIECGASVDSRNDAGQDAVEFHCFQSAAIRRDEAKRVKYYAQLREASAYDAALQAKLMTGLEAGSQEQRAKEHDALALRLQQFR